MVGTDKSAKTTDFESVKQLHAGLFRTAGRALKSLGYVFENQLTKRKHGVGPKTVPAGFSEISTLRT
jgi:hypothetical protein